MRQDSTGMLDGGILEEGVPGEPKAKKGSDEISGSMPEVVVLGGKAPSKLMQFFYRAKNWVKQKDNYELLIGVLPFAGSLYDIARGIYDGDYYQMGFGLVMLGTELFTLGLGGATARLVLKASFKGGGKVAFKSAGERVGKFFRKTFTRAERKAGKNSVKRDSQPFEEFIDNGGYGRKAEGAGRTSTPLTKNSVIEGFKVSNHAWRKSGLGRGAPEELISDVIIGARKAGTVITETGTGKFAGNVIKVFNHNGVKVIVDETRQLIMTIRPEKGFKLP